MSNIGDDKEKMKSHNSEISGLQQEIDTLKQDNQFLAEKHIESNRQFECLQKSFEDLKTGHKHLVDDYNKLQNENDDYNKKLL